MELQDEFYSNAEYIETVCVVKILCENTVRIISPLQIYWGKNSKTDS